MWAVLYSHRRNVIQPGRNYYYYFNRIFLVLFVLRPLDEWSVFLVFAVITWAVNSSSPRGWTVFIWATDYPLSVTFGWYSCIGCTLVRLACWFSTQLYRGVACLHAYFLLNYASRVRPTPVRQVVHDAMPSMYNIVSTRLTLSETSWLIYDSHHCLLILIWSIIVTHVSHVSEMVCLDSVGEFQILSSRLFLLEPWFWWLKRNEMKHR